ncbi:tail fiber domain-containing protein [Jeotgalicoccus sp. WY2]|uniref:tail fiber domain-containing protein n=1 Tax=Jeotgalicoccus sp. WY2 TaxID=2708346 RepID=UPI001BD64938|nr:tail fiber domain-containing protein [Jeotgalicoccus sp. WY2]
MYGEDGDKYMYMTGAQFISHGDFTRTWTGVTDTAELNLGIYNGRIMVSNEVTGYNLYMTEKGLSTTMSGAIEDFTAGTLEFHSQRYNEESRGVTLHSTSGAVALESDYSTIYTVSDLTNNIESRQYSVYVRPFRDSRNGVNEFQFYVKDNESSSETDGALLFGNLTEGATHGSGIRFSKQRDNPKIYATNNNGDIGTGGLPAKEVQAESIRVLDEGSNLYLGTSTGEVRVTNNLLYNGADIGYKPIKASAFTQASFQTYKTNIEDVGNIGLETIKGLNVVEYDLIDDIEEGVTDNRQIGLIAEHSGPVATKELTGIDLYKMSSYSIKAIQELEGRVKLLEAK